MKTTNAKPNPQPELVQQLSPPTKKKLVAAYLSDKRKSVAVFRALSLDVLVKLHEIITEQIKFKQYEEALLAEQKQQEQAQINQAISGALTQLQSQGVSFNEGHLREYLSHELKASKGQGKPKQSDSTNIEPTNVDEGDPDGASVSA